MCWLFGHSPLKPLKSLDFRDRNNQKISTHKISNLRIPTISLRTVNPTSQQQQQQSLRQIVKQQKTAIYHQAASMLVSAHQESEIEYEQSFQAMSLEEDEIQQSSKVAQINKSKMVNNESSLLLVEHHANSGGSSSSASHSSTSSPSSSSSLIMDAKDLYDFGANGHVSCSSTAVMVVSGQQAVSSRSNIVIFEFLNLFKIINFGCNNKKTQFETFLLFVF